MGVNKLKSKPLSAVKTVKLKYLDDTISFDKVDYATSETFNFSFYNFLKNPNDIAVNNYSYFFLSKKGLFSDQISYTQKQNDNNAILTTLQFDFYREPSFLYFESTSATESTTDANVFVNGATLHSETVLERQGITTENITNYSGYLFIIEFITGTNKCYIKHISNSQEYYLYNSRVVGSSGSYSSINSVAFTTDKEIIKTFGQFTYILDGEKISLSLVEPDLINVTVDGVTITDSNGVEQPVTAWIHSTINVNSANNTIKEATGAKDKCIYPVDTQYIGHTFTINEKIRIRGLYNRGGVLNLEDNRQLSVSLIYPTAKIKLIKNTLSPNSYINSAWLSYTDSSTTDINVSRSTFDLENQCIYHLQYNNIDTDDFSTTVNIIPLKNHVSPKNNIIRGDYMQNDISSDKPNVNFREYTAIETGGYREFGNETIILSYTYYNEEYTVKPGEDFHFTIRQNDPFVTGDLTYSLYPYKQLNINNSQFINNGALGSTIPALSDKVKKLQKDSLIFNNGRYLCTWLYQTDEMKQGIWLDRYYYPDRISKKESYYGTANFNTNSDIIDKEYIYQDNSWNEELNDSLGQATYFDKQSDLVIEPGTKYIYSHIGTEDVNSVIDKIEPFNINTIDNFISDNNIDIIDSAKIKDAGMIDFSFDMFINPEKKYGPCILSNSVTNGISINNEDDVTPFIYLFDGCTIYLNNTNGTKINSLNIKEFYSNSTDIQFIAIEKPFKDIVAVTEDYAYIFSFDLLLKKRIHLDFLTKETYTSWANINYKVKTGILSDNILYLIISKDIDGQPVSRIIRLDLITESWNELNKYAKSGISLVWIRGGERLPVQNSNIASNDRLVSTSSSYPAPIKNSSSNIISTRFNNPEYTPEYWYYAPEFKPDIGGEPINNAGLIDTLYIQNGKLYAFPYYKIGKMQDADLIYGVRKRTDYSYQVELISLSNYELQVKDTGSSNIAFNSVDKFTEFAINLNEEFILIKHKNNEDFMLIFDSAKRLLRTINLTALGYIKIFALDTAKIYNNGTGTTPFICIGKHYNSETKELTTRLLTIDNGGEINPTILDTPVSDKLNCLTNYTSVIASSKNGIKFNLNIENRQGLFKTFTYLFDYTTATIGWYSFRVLVDSTEDKFEVFCNNKLLPIINNFDISSIGDKHLFDSPVLFGTLKYKRDTLLSDFLQLDKNQFDTKNIKIKNNKWYSKILNDAEWQAVQLNSGKLHPITITLPCGQKNNLEEIIRYFKFTPPSNIANTISINIKHSGIEDIATQKQLAVDLLNKINTELSLPVTIKEINFI